MVKKENKSTEKKEKGRPKGEGKETQPLDAARKRNARRKRNIHKSEHSSANRETLKTGNARIKTRKENQQNNRPYEHGYKNPHYHTMQSKHAQHRPYTRATENSYKKQKQPGSNNGGGSTCSLKKRTKTRKARKCEGRLKSHLFTSWDRRRQYKQTPKLLQNHEHPPKLQELKENTGMHAHT